MSKLTLLARKNIKENEEKQTEFKEEIKTAVDLSSDITLDVDFAAFGAFVDKANYQNRVGDVTSWYLEGLTSQMKRIFTEETAKASLQAAWSTGVIRIELGTLKKGESKYVETRIDNGDLIITVYQIGNTGDTGRDLLDKLGDSSGLSLKAAQNIKAKEEEKAERLSKIHEMTGLSGDVTVDLDLIAFAAFVDKANYKDRVGDVLDWYLEGLESKIKRYFSEDELAKASLQAAWTTGVIRFEIGTLKKGESKYVATKIDNGDLLVTVYQIGNTGDTGADLLGTLGDASGLSLKAAQNLKAKEETKQERLEKIKEHTQISADITVDLDQLEFAAFVDKANYKDRIGDVLDWYLEGLESKLKRYFAEDELARGSLQAAWTTGVIRFALGTLKKGESKYVETKIDNGDLLVTVYQIGNTGDTGGDLLGTLGDASGLSLKAAQNLKAKEETKQERLEKIKEYTQVSADVTVDFDLVAFSAFVDKANYKDRIGDVLDWYLDGLESKLKRAFHEDDTAKAALQAVWTTGVIRIELGTLKKGESKYVSTRCDNGDLIITVYQIGNTGDTGADLVGTLNDASGVSLKAALNLKDKEERKGEFLEKIKEYTQLSCDVTLDFDLVAFSAFVDKANYKDRVGDVLDWYLEGLAGKVSRFFKDDEVARAALQAAWTTGVIRINLGTLKKGESKYVTSATENGDLVITVFQIGNTGDTGQDLVGNLGDPETGLSLKSALNLKAQEEKKQENLDAIKEAVGLADCTIDIDLVAIDAITAKANYVNRIGDVVYDWILSALASNLKRICGDEMVKEAVAEAWSTGVICMEENKKINYFDVEFVNGDLVIQYGKSYPGNSSEVGKTIESKL